jgi:tRNA uridine 5-carbamoylmethylation protein Kti12
MESNRWDKPLFKVVMGGKSGAEPTAVTPVVAVGPVESTTETIPTTVFKSSWKPKSKKLVDSMPAPVTTPLCPATVPASASLTFSGSALESGDDFSSFQQPEAVLMDIYNHLVTTTVLVPNSSTIIAVHAQADMLYELDRTSQKILSAIMSHQTDCAEGTPIQFLDYDRAITLHRHISLSELQRFRRQFVKINAQHPPSSPKEIGSSFVDFLASQL